jgi:hypothetical protein
VGPAWGLVGGGGGPTGWVRRGGWSEVRRGLEEGAQRRVDDLRVGEVGGVGRTLDDDEAAAVPHAVAELLGPAHRDREVLVAVDDQRRRVDLPEPVGDVVTVEQRGRRRHQTGGGPLRPLGLPARLLLGVAEDQPGHDRREVLLVAVGHPAVDHRPVTRDLLGFLRRRLGVDEDEGAHPVGVQQGRAQRHVPALGHAGEHGPLDTEVVEQPEQVARRIPVRERLAAGLGATEATLVPGDHPVRRRELLHLVAEHLVVHQEAVAEHDGRAVSPRVLEEQALTVDVRVRHGGSLPVAVGATATTRRRS